MPDGAGRKVPEGRTKAELERGARERRPARGGHVAPVFTTPAMPADEVAMLAMRLRVEAELAAEPQRCDACDAPIEGEPSGSGLYVWPGEPDRPRVEEPPLCEACATAIGFAARRSFEDDGEEDG